MLNIGKIPRYGEMEAPPHRSKRVFKMHQDWYFSTREGLNPGPYESQEQAEKAADDFVQFAMVSDEKLIMQLLYSLTDAEQKERSVKYN